MMKISATKSVVKQFQELGKRSPPGFIFNGKIIISRLLHTSFFLTLFINELDSQPTLPISLKKVESNLLATVDVLDLYVAPRTNITWIKTTKGMMSFDGIELLLYEDTLTGNYFSSLARSDQKICVANDGNLYLWKYNAGLILFDTKTGRYKPCLVQEKYIQEFRGLAVSSVLQDKAGDIWLSTTASGLVRYSINDHSVNYFNVPYSTLVPIIVPRSMDSTSVSVSRIGKNFSAMSPAYNDDNYLWLASASVIWKFNKRERSFSLEFFPDTTDRMRAGFVINTIIDFNADTLVFTARGGGLGFYQKPGKSIMFYPVDSLFYSRNGIKTSNNLGLNFCHDDGKGFYVGYSDHHPVFFSTKTKININLTTEKATKGYKVFLDHTGRVWTFGNNAIYYSVNRSSLFKSIDISFQHRKKIVYNTLFSLLWDETSGKYLAGINASDGVTVWDSNFLRSAIYPVFSPLDKLRKYTEVEPAVLGIAGSGQNYWAITGGDILLSFDPKKKQFLQAPLFNNERIINPITNSQDKVLSILNSRDKNTYALLGNWSVLKINHDFSSVEKGIINDSMIQKNWFIGKIFEGIDTTFLYVTDYNNIYRLDRHSGKIKNLIRAGKKNFPRSILDAAVDAYGNLWVASSDNKIICYGADEMKPIKQLTAETQFWNSLVITPGNILLCSEKKSLLIYDINQNILMNYGAKSGVIPGELNKVFYTNGYVFLAYPDRVDYLPLEKLLIQSTTPTPYLARLQFYNNDLSTDSLLWYQHTIKLNHKQNNPTFTFSLENYDTQEDVVFYYRFSALDTAWVSREFHNRVVTYTNLKPGKYRFQIKAKLSNAAESEISTYEIIIQPAFWQTIFFKLICLLITVALGFYFYKRRIGIIREKEKQKAVHEKEMLELEARALRAQMNPHFIFNCLNSIKSLMQENEMDKGVTYLTTFSKLIRTLFNNADKKEISLYDEIETCKLYLQLETMRFDSKFSYNVNIDETIDLKSISVPALIIQPFIENAIWHGIVPKGNGGNVSLTVNRKNSNIEIAVEDNGIGRESSQQNKGVSGIRHQSKGVNLTQSRLELDNLLQQRKAKLEIFDKKDHSGKAIGTRVILTLPQED